MLKVNLKVLAALMAFFSLAVVGVVLASTFINVHDGPTWDDANNVYVTGICSDTAYGEQVCTQYTTDGTALQHDGNNPSLWNGTKVGCTFKDNTTCTSYWQCGIPETANATINYQFYVVNQDAGNNCNYNGNVYYGQKTADASFQTGPNAVTLAHAVASSPWSMPALFAGLLGLIGGVIFWRKLA